MDGLDPHIVDDIRRVAAKLAHNELSRSEYLQHGRFSAYQIYEGGQSWEKYCHAAGVVTRKIEPVPDEIYFSRLIKAVESLGRLPKTSERKKFGLNFSKRRYSTLKTFIEEASRRGIVTVPERIPPDGEPLDEAPQSETGVVETGEGGLSLSPKRPVPPIPTDTRRTKWERSGIEGFPYAPQDELGVVALFGILCASRRIEWQILELRGGKGIDATCYDHLMGTEIRVELKHTFSRASWNHRAEEVDYVVCWENRWPDFPKPVIVLRDVIRKGE